MPTAEQLVWRTRAALSQISTNGRLFLSASPSSCQDVRQKVPIRSKGIVFPSADTLPSLGSIRGDTHTHTHTERCPVFRAAMDSSQEALTPAPQASLSARFSSRPGVKQVCVGRSRVALSHTCALHTQPDHISHITHHISSHSHVMSSRATEKVQKQ